MKDKLKILQINKFYFLKGGSERYLFDLSKILEVAGHQVIPFAMRDEKNWPSSYREYFSEPMDLHKFSLKNIFKIFFNWDARRRLEELINRTKPDLAHLHIISYQLSPSVIAVLKRRNIPIVMTLHDYSPICPNAKLFTRGGLCERCRGGKYYHCFLNKCSHNSYGQSFLAMLESYVNLRWLKVYENVDLFIAPSQFVKDVGVKFGLPENKIKVINHFIEINNNFQDVSSSNYILYFGRLDPGKGISVLLEAMRHVNQRISLKLVGVGPDYKKLKNEIERLNLSGRVELLGSKYGDELLVLIQGALAIIVPSILPESMGYSALESLAMGKIVIASRIGGLSEIIQDGENGFLFKAGDSDELAKKINLAVERDESIKNMENNAKKSVSGLTPENHYEKIMELYKKIIDLDGR